MKDKIPESKPRLLSTLTIVCVKGHKTVQTNVLDTCSHKCPKCGCGWQSVAGEY